MGFSKQGYCSGFPFPSPGDLPDPGTELRSLVSHALAGGFFTTAPSGKPLLLVLLKKNKKYGVCLTIWAALTNIPETE